MGAPIWALSQRSPGPDECGNTCEAAEPGTDSKGPRVLNAEEVNAMLLRATPSSFVVALTR